MLSNVMTRTFLEALYNIAKELNGIFTHWKYNVMVHIVFIIFYSFEIELALLFGMAF